MTTSPPNDLHLNLLCAELYSRWEEQTRPSLLVVDRYGRTSQTAPLQLRVVINRTQGTTPPRMVVGYGPPDTTTVTQGLYGAFESDIGGRRFQVEVDDDAGVARIFVHGVGRSESQRALVRLVWQALIISPAREAKMQQDIILVAESRTFAEFGSGVVSALSSSLGLVQIPLPLPDRLRVKVLERTLANVFRKQDEPSKKAEGTSPAADAAPTQEAQPPPPADALQFPPPPPALAFVPARAEWPSADESAAPPSAHQIEPLYSNSSKETNSKLIKSDPDEKERDLRPASAPLPNPMAPGVSAEPSQTSPSLETVPLKVAMEYLDAAFDGIDGRAREAQQRKKTEQAAAAAAAAERARKEAEHEARFHISVGQLWDTMVLAGNAEFQRAIGVGQVHASNAYGAAKRLQAIKAQRDAWRRTAAPYPASRDREEDGSPDEVAARDRARGAEARRELGLVNAECERLAERLRQLSAVYSLPTIKPGSDVMQQVVSQTQALSVQMSMLQDKATRLARVE